MSIANDQIPSELREKWQDIVNLLAEVMHVPAALIMKVESPEIMVYASNQSPENPYKRGERAHLDTRLYCETVMRTRQMLLVPNALDDDVWKTNPDVQLGMISYLGFPITWPDGQLFGTICVLDTKTNAYSDLFQRLLRQFRDVVQLDLKLLTEHIQTFQAQIQNIQEQREQLELIMDTMPAMLAYADANQRYLYVNQAYADWYGRTKADILGQRLPDIMHPRAYQRAFPSVQSVLQGQKVVYENVAFHQDQPQTVRVTFVPHLDENGRAKAFLAMFEDITESKRTETVLRESEERYRALFNQAGASITLIDLDTGQKLHFNQYAHEHLGYTAEEFAALSVAEIDMEPPEEAIDHLRQLQTAGHVRFETKHRTKQGELRDMLINAKVIDYYGKRVIQGIGHDITDLKQAQDAIRKLNADLEERVRQRTAQLEMMNKELESFAYVVSHDLKAPLRGISHLVDWLVQDYAHAFDERGKEMATLLVNRVQRMDNLIEGILEYSRIGRIVGSSIAIDLRQLLPEVIDMLVPPSNITITISPELPVIVGDKTRIVQVFQNLISNAIKFMDKPQGEIRVSCTEVGDFWQFKIADNGPGIDPKYHDKIFQIFQTLKPRDEQESTGVGLTIVKKIVEYYGGRIGVASDVGQGSTFWFTLPKIRPS